jgi:hypothetical protein
VVVVAAASELPSQVRSIIINNEGFVFDLLSFIISAVFRTSLFIYGGLTTTTKEKTPPGVIIIIIIISTPPRKCLDIVILSSYRFPFSCCCFYG